jgi:hypothetical protein
MFPMPEYRITTWSYATYSFLYAHVTSVYQWNSYGHRPHRCLLLPTNKIHLHINHILFFIKEWVTARTNAPFSIFCRCSVLRFCYIIIGILFYFYVVVSAVCTKYTYVCQKRVQIKIYVVDPSRCHETKYANEIFRTTFIVYFTFYKNCLAI